VATSASLGGWNVARSTPCGATVTRCAGTPTRRPSSSRVAVDGTTRPAARLAAKRVAVRKKRALTGECSCGWVKNVASWMVTTVGNRGAGRLRVVRAVQHVSPFAPGQSGQANLLPGQAHRPPLERGRTRNAAHAESGEVRVVGRLAHHADLGAGTPWTDEAGEQAVQVSPDATTISRDGGRVDQYADQGR